MGKVKIIKLIRLILYCLAFFLMAFSAWYHISCQRVESQNFDWLISGNIKQIPPGGSCFGTFDLCIFIALFALAFIIFTLTLILAARKMEVKLDEVSKEKSPLIAYSGGYYGIQYATIPFIKISLYNAHLLT